MTGDGFDLVCIDPGGDRGHTGLVHLFCPDENLPWLMSSAAIPDGWQGVADCFLPRADIVVMEKFINWNTPGADLSVVRTEGAILSRYRLEHQIEVVEQGSSGKNTAVPDKALKELGLWFTGDHHRDRTEAARHALMYLKRKRHMPTLEFLVDL